MNIDSKKIQDVQYKISELKKNIKILVENIENANNNIFEHIRKKSLEAKLERLLRIEKILQYKKYKIVFIGTIGEGKTTAICHLFNLVRDFYPIINNNKSSVAKTDALLSTGAGRTTISEVIIKQDTEIFIEIEPYSKEKLESIIRAFCNSFYDDNSSHTISTEIERAIRAMTKFKKTTKKIKDKKKLITKTIDFAKQKSTELNKEELIQLALENANLDNRFYTKEASKALYKSGSKKLWLQETFDKINKGEYETFSIPKKIYVYVNKDIVKESKLDLFESIIDTKGIDENPITEDLITYIEEENTICLFTSSYNDAPESNIRELIKYSLTNISKNYEDRFVTFVMPHKGEPEKENDSDGTREAGIQIKKDITNKVYKDLDLKLIDENILFYDALQFYDSNGRIDRDYESEPEIIQETKDEIINSIAEIIENRRDRLSDEVDNIKNEYTEITEGKTLSENEKTQLDNIIMQLDTFSEINDRVPSFVYEEFIESYVDYYSERYKAWNTKDAIHRRKGTFEERRYDTYFDAKVVAKGLDDNKMLRKFTKKIKNGIIETIKEIGSIHDDLRTFIPEILKSFDIMYDNFIDETGDKLEEYMRDKNENIDFWREAINRRGKGRGYNVDVCTILGRKLSVMDTGISANRLLQEFTEKTWKKMLKELLTFFSNN